MKPGSEDTSGRLFGALNATFGIGVHLMTFFFGYLIHFYGFDFGFKTCSIFIFSITLILFVKEKNIMNKNMFIKDIISNFKDNDLSIDERKSLIFYEFYKYLINENKKYNLTTIVDPRDVIKKHFFGFCLAIS